MRLPSHTEPITIRNAGSEIVDTDYFDSVLCQYGCYFLSFSGRTARLLVPHGEERDLREMATGDHVTISRGPWELPLRLQSKAIELLFENGSASPYALQISRVQYSEIPAQWVNGRKNLRLLVYTAGPTLRFTLPARYRDVPGIPWLRPWS